MFNNISTKLKALAYIISISGIAASLVSGIALLFEREILWGFLCILLGGLSSWIVCFPLYGLAQSIENTEALIRYKLDEKYPNEKHY